MKSGREATWPWPARARPGPPTRPSRPGATHHPAHRPAALSGLPPARVLTGATPRASTPWLAPRTPPRPPNHLVPAPGQPSVRGRRRPPRLASMSPAHDARPGDPGRSADRSPRPTRGGPGAADPGRLPDTPPSEPRDGGTPPGRPAPAILPTGRPPPRPRESRAGERLSKPEPDRPKGQRQREAASAGHRAADSRVAARSSPRAERKEV